MMRPQYADDGLPPYLLSSLISTTPWNEQVQSLTHLTDLALTPSASTLRQLRTLTPYFQSAINNPRSTLVRSVCETISNLAETLQAPFVEAVGNAIIPNLLNRSAVTKAVIRDSCVNAARSMFEYGVEGVHFATVKTLADAVIDRRAPAVTRATAALFIGMILVENCRSGVQYIIDVVATAIIAGCADPDENVRATSRENWRRLDALDPGLAVEVLSNLPSQTVQLINRERDEVCDPFRMDRRTPSHVRTTAEMPVRSLSSVRLRPGRVEVDEQPSETKVRTKLRPPRRSVLPGAFVNLQSASPDESPPKRNDMNAARRIFSPMAVDTPAPLDTASVNDMSSPTMEETAALPTKSKNTKMSPSTTSEKSSVSAVSCSTKSNCESSKNENLLANDTTHTTNTDVSTVSSFEGSVSTVSPSSLSTEPSLKNEETHEKTFQKIAGSGVSRGTNEEPSPQAPPHPLHPNACSALAEETSPKARKGRLSFILGTDRTPGVYTPLPPISRMIEPEEHMKTFTPMDICTPMKHEGDPDRPMSGVVVKPVARTLEERLDEVAQSQERENNEKPKHCEVDVGNDDVLLEEDAVQEENGLQSEKEVNCDAKPSGKDGHCDAQIGEYVAQPEENTNEQPEEILAGSTQNDKPTTTTEEPVETNESATPDECQTPSTPDTLEDEDILQKVASLTNSAEKKRDLSDEKPLPETSWDTLVQDLESTLGLRAQGTDDPSLPEKQDKAETPFENAEAPLEKAEASAEVEIVKPGEGKENQLPVSPQKELENPKKPQEVTAKDPVEEKEKAKGRAEMTKAERQAALARRPPRRSINPGAIKPIPVEKRVPRPSIPPQVPPRLERRKPPLPSFNRKPPVPRKSPTAVSDQVARSSTTGQKAPVAAEKVLTTTRKPPTTTRKPSSNRPRVSTALTRPSTSAQSVRRTSTAPTRPRQSTAPNVITKPTPAQSSANPKPVSALPSKAPKAPARRQTPRQTAVIDAYRACARAKTGIWSAKWKSLQDLLDAIKGLQGDSLPPRLCDDATGLLGEYAQETHHKVQLSALDALFFLLLCTERPPQITALHRALEKRPDILRRVLALLKDGREDVRLACGRVMQSFEVLFGPEVQIALLVKAVSGFDGKIAEMGCVHMLKTFERAKQGDGFVWKGGVLESLVSLLGGLKNNRRIEVRQGASKVLGAVKECLPDRAFEIVCKKVGVSV